MTSTARSASRVAVVTGAARGIGAATVRRLCADGYAVVAVDACGGAAHDAYPGVDYPLADRADLARLAEVYPDAVLARVADVRDPAAMTAAAEAAVERFGRLDVVVAAAAVIAGGRPQWETPTDQVRTLWDVDVLGVWHTIAACVPVMLDGPDPSGCRVVAVASAAGARGLFHLAAYAMAKHAVVGLVRGLAADLVGTGVTAVAVSPGSTRTPMLAATAELYGIDDVEAFAESQLLRRLLEPDEVAAVIAWCCARESAPVNGADIAADGGFSG